MGSLEGFMCLLGGEVLTKPNYFSVHLNMGIPFIDANIVIGSAQMVWIFTIGIILSSITNPEVGKPIVGTVSVDVVNFSRKNIVGI